MSDHYWVSNLTLNSSQRLPGRRSMHDLGNRGHRWRCTMNYAGNLSSKTVDAVTTTYGYDVIDQLTSEATTGYSASYAYDANGNRTSKTLNGSTDTYTVDDGDKLTGITNGGISTKSYTYDAAGRTKTVVTPAGTTTLTYDYESRVTGITYPSAATNSFTYNGLDTRVGKVDSAGTATYRRDGVGVTDPVLNDGSAAYTPGVSQRRSGVTTYELNDRLGTASRQTDTSATTTATRTYDAFGMLLASTGTPKGPFGFAGAHGYQEDSDSGLKLLGHRYYDASTGRFLNRDPTQDGRNWYIYVANNPGDDTDDDGLAPKGPPKIKHKSRGDAEEGARRDGSGKPIHHPNPNDGSDPHFHPTGPDGEKIPGRHHEYPPRNSRPGPQFPRPNQFVEISLEIGLGVWEGFKVITAIGAAPETCGASLVLLAAP